MFSITGSYNRKTATNPITVGFVFPIYSLGIPRMVEKAVESMKLQGSEYIYAVATMGGAYGIAFEQLEKILKKKKRELSAAFAIAVGSNSNLFIKIPGTTPILSIEEQGRLWEKASDEIDRIVKTVTKQTKATIERPSLGFRLISKMVHSAFVKRLPKFDQEFNTSGCTMCGKCRDHCPVKNIILEKDVPIWLGKCEGCLRCFNICSNKAINFGKMDDPRMNERYQRNIDLVIGSEQLNI